MPLTVLERQISLTSFSILSLLGVLYAPFTSPNHDHVSSFSCEEDEVFRILSTLDGSKAVGIDGISPLFLRHCAVALTPPLTRLFNLSLSTHSLSLEWRTHIVKPIFKLGDKCNFANN